METLWFCLVTFTIAMYVVLDGFDLGAGAVQCLVGRTPERRRAVQSSIGGIWDGNEVWLLAAGATLLLAFPAAFAAALSGMYLAFMIMLWLLMLRGISLAFRNEVDDPLWRKFWDVAFAGSSILLAALFGAALGNVVRGVPLDEAGDCFLPLWQDLTPYGVVGILDWYTALLSVTAVAALARHGCLWVVLRTDGDLSDEVKAWSARLTPAVAGLTLVAAIATYSVQPNLAVRLEDAPWGYALFPIVFGALAVSWKLARGARCLGAFAASGVYLFAMVACAAFTIFPYVLPGTLEAHAGLHVVDAASTEYGLSTALGWWVPGILLAVGYFSYLYRQVAKGVLAGH